MQINSQELLHNRVAKIKKYQKKKVSNARKDVKQPTLSYTAGVYWLQPLWQTGSQFSAEVEYT